MSLQSVFRDISFTGGIVALALSSGLATAAASHDEGNFGAGAEVKEPPAPTGVDVFDLNLGQTRALSRSRNFEVVGHDYFKGPWLTKEAAAQGLGAGFNTPRVYDGIGYFAGYSFPPTLFGTLITDVHDPRDMEVLSFVPCEAGTRCPYVRVNNDRKIMIGTHDTNSGNPDQPPPGTAARAGVSFHDVSDPENPELLGFFVTKEDGATHGLEIDGDFVYACAELPSSKPGLEQVAIINYRNPTAPFMASTVHIRGQRVGEDFDELDRFNPDGTPQLIKCHEITVHNDRLYIAYRDAGMVIVDVADPFNPEIISRLDYVPPFHGGGLGAAHTSQPVVVEPDEHPTLVIHTDEIFDCPPGFGRIFDVSDLANPQVLTSYRIPHVTDVYDFDAQEFICPQGQQSIHTPWFDHQSPSLFYQAWYDQGVRAWDISNPFLPKEVGHYLSPRYEPVGRSGRQTREVFQDPDTGLLYMTDGNGGGITVLRWTGPIPENPPMPGARGELD